MTEEDLKLIVKEASTPELELLLDELKLSTPIDKNKLSIVMNEIDQRGRPLPSME